MLTLYYSPGACSLAPHITLEELGEPFATKRIVIPEGQNRTPDYLALNPAGQVPTLTVDTEVLTQNVAILSFLGQRAPDKKLLPADPLQRAQAVSQMAFLSSTVHPAFGRWFKPVRVIADEAQGAAVKAIAKDAIAGYFKEIDETLAGREYFSGSDFGVVDAYLHVFYRWGGRIELDMSRYENYAAHGKRVAARPSVGRALADEGLV